VTEHIGASSLPKATAQWRSDRTWTCCLWIAKFSTSTKRHNATYYSYVVVCSLPLIHYCHHKCTDIKSFAQSLLRNVNLPHWSLKILSIIHRSGTTNCCTVLVFMLPLPLLLAWLVTRHSLHHHHLHQEFVVADYPKLEQQIYFKTITEKVEFTKFKPLLCAPVTLKKTNT